MISLICTKQANKQAHETQVCTLARLTSSDFGAHSTSVRTVRRTSLDVGAGDRNRFMMAGAYNNKQG